MNNEVEIRITSKNLSSPGFKATEREAKRSGDQIGKNITEGSERGVGRLPSIMSRVGNRAGDALRKAIRRGADDIGSDAHKMGEDAGEEFEDGAKGKAEGGGKGGIFGSILTSVKGGVATAAAAVGVAAGAALVAGLQSAMAKKTAMSKLSAQLADPGMAKMAGAAAGAVYKEGFGEAFSDVADAARRALQSGVADTPGDLRKVTRAAMALAETFDVDVRESMAAAQALIANGLAKDGPAAFDLISKAMTNTGDLSDDMMDTITEYSTQFRDLGLSAPKSLGMISQMVKAGARNTDLAADALKEFAIRSKDGSDTSRLAFEGIGLDADKMFQVFAAGGPKADAAFADVIKRLKGIKDPAEKAALSTKLFGTQSEDLQDALYAIDPTTAVDAFGEVGGAAQKMGDTLAEDPAKKIERMKRAVSEKLTEFAGGAIGVFEDIAKDPQVRKFADELSENVMPILQEIGDYISEELGPFFSDVLGGALKSGRKAFNRLSSAVKDNEPELKQLYKWMKKVAEYVQEKLGPIIGPMLVANITMTINILSGIVRAIGGTIRAFNRLRSGASSAANGVRSRFNSMMGFIRGLPGRIGSIVSGMFRGIPRAARAAVNSARNILNGIINFARSIPGRVRDTISSGLGDAISSLPGFAHGGIVGAATGGARSGLIMAGEHGRELIRVPGGSQVIPNGQTERMIQSSGGGGGSAQLEISSDGTRIGDALIELLRLAIRKKGGNVQVILAGRAL